MSDAEWLADVAAHGMVRPSFVPPPPVRELRELTRYRKTQITVRAAEIARLEKVLQDAGIKLTSVASKVLTQSGRAMVEALIAGERDPAALAGLAKGKLRPKIPQLTAALRGHFGAHHAIVAARILAHLAAGLCAGPADRRPVHRDSHDRHPVGAQPGHFGGQCRAAVADLGRGQFGGVGGRARDDVGDAEAQWQ
jgi:hypothetical protein